MTWFPACSPCFPSNFGIFEGSFLGIDGQFWSCSIGSFVSLLKSGIFYEAKKNIRAFPTIVNRLWTAMCSGVLCGDVLGGLPWWLAWGLSGGEVCVLPKGIACRDPSRVVKGVPCCGGVQEKLHQKWKIQKRWLNDVFST